MKTSVLAIDVGYGNTKYAYRAANNKVVTGMFPSLAPLAPIRMFSGDAEWLLPARKVVTITIDHIEYQVGPDVPITAAYGYTGRVLTDDYVLTHNYAALLFGAIYFSGVTHIKCLVLGLSDQSINNYSTVLKEKFIGEHDFGHGRITIEKVVVIPQPLGSLVFAASSSGGSFRRDDAHLVIDVGYFTTDWTYANGFKLDHNRSGGIQGGASQIAQYIAKLISDDEGEQIMEIELIDKALREKAPFFFYGKNIDLAPYVKRATQIVINVGANLQNHVGSLPDVRSIILSGGGAVLYAMEIRRLFPRVVIKLIDSPCLANVRGFLIVGEVGLARERYTA
jgi:plasmid segregation protein ParM